MELNLTHDDLCSGNTHTAALLRALAAALSPEPAAVTSVHIDPAPAQIAAVEVATHAVRGTLSSDGAGVGLTLPNGETVEVKPAAAPEFGLDSAGFPWDERIHASSRATVADGTWKLKRGVDHELVAQIRAAAVPPPPTEGERLQAEQDHDVPDPAKVGFGQQVPPPPPPVAITVQSSTLTLLPWPVDVLGVIPEGKTPFQVFMTWAMAKLTDKSLTQPRLLGVIQAHGITQLPVLNTQPDVIPYIVRDLVGG